MATKALNSHKSSTLKYVAYYRVSTDKQKKSGLGLQAQQDIVKHFSAKDGAQIIQEYIETESGKEIDNRDKLRKAIKYCQINACTLIVAKLDRLSRDVEHVFRIKKQLGVNLICCDLPTTDSLTLSIFAGPAQREREIISIRTKSALQAKKAQGFKLGKPENFSYAARLKGAQAQKAKARKNVDTRKATPLIIEYREKGYTFQRIADELTSHGFVTPSGGHFYRTSVKRLYDAGIRSGGEDG